MLKVLVALVILLLLAGCATAPAVPDYAAIIKVDGVILGVVEIGGQLFFIGTVPETEWTPPRVESTQS